MRITANKYMFVSLEEAFVAAVGGATWVKGLSTAGGASVLVLASRLDVVTVVPLGTELVMLEETPVAATGAASSSLCIGRRAAAAAAAAAAPPVVFVATAVPLVLETGMFWIGWAREAECADVLALSSSWIVFIGLS